MVHSSSSIVAANMNPYYRQRSRDHEIVEHDHEQPDRRDRERPENTAAFHCRLFPRLHGSNAARGRPWPLRGKTEGFSEDLRWSGRYPPYVEEPPSVREGARQLPTGTVTFLFTDIEGSTAMLRALGRERFGEVGEPPWAPRTGGRRSRWRGGRQPGRRPPCCLLRARKAPLRPRRRLRTPWRRPSGPVTRRSRYAWASTAESPF